MYAVGLAVGGYRPITATAAEPALDLIHTERPDAVVTDLRLPGTLDGLDLVRNVKQDTASRQIPIIVLTGYTDPDIDVSARTAGCAAVITKPCSTDELIDVLEHIWAPDADA